MAKKNKEIEKVDDNRLTMKQQKFVEFYQGNGVEAARLAGYGGDDATLRAIASENLTKPNITEAIRRRSELEKRPLIMKRIDRQVMWSQIAQSEELDLAARLRASELLGRSECDFVEKVEMQVNESVATILDRARERVRKNKNG